MRAGKERNGTVDSREIIALPFPLCLPLKGKNKKERKKKSNMGGGEEGGEITRGFNPRGELSSLRS